MSMIIIALILAMGISVILNCYLASALEKEGRRNEELAEENEELREWAYRQRDTIDLLMDGDGPEVET